MEERIIDVPGYEGYYQISESGRLYRVRPNMKCGVDIVKELPVKPNKQGLRLVTISKNGVSWVGHLHCLLHDSFFPERAGMRFELNGPMHVNNIVFLDNVRYSKKEDVVFTIKAYLKNNPSSSLEDLSSFLKIKGERLHQLLKEATGKRHL